MEVIIITKEKVKVLDPTVRKAYAEVYDIIYHMEMDLFEKIPESFFVMLEENMDRDYIVNIDYDLGINNQELLPETRAALAMIYSNFICDEKEKQELDNYYSQKNKEEQEKRSVENSTGHYNSLEERLRDLRQTNQVQQVSKSDIEENENVVSQEKSLANVEKKPGLFQRILAIFGIKK